MIYLLDQSFSKRHVPRYQNGTSPLLLELVLEPLLELVLLPLLDPPEELPPLDPPDEPPILLESGAGFASPSKTR